MKHGFVRTSAVVVLVLAALLLAGLGIGLAMPASAASGRASCAGIEFSSISPPGSSPEDPGGAAQAAHEIQGIAGELGVPPGAIVSFVTGLHEGSHEACDEAIE